MPRLSIALTVFLVGCAARAPLAPASPPAPAGGAPREPLAWAPFEPATFARAAREHKLVVLDGAAEWCHWCHVMEATTYHDPEVRRLLAERFVAVKVDIDARPDVAERYAEWGWPATVIFGPDGAEVGRYRGYLPPDRFLEVLRTASAAPTLATSAVGASRPAPDVPLGAETLDFVARFTEAELDDYWDDEQGGWGRSQKAPVGPDNLWLLDRGFRHGDREAQRKARFVLDQQAKLLDPIWGGIYQYSAASDWDHPHYEKLMTFQAAALETYAVAFRLTGDPRQRARAESVRGYIDRFLRGPEGGFYTTQDADLNAHAPGLPYLDGPAYYALDERGRLARGLPRVDTHEYARENGLAIAAYVALHEATGEPAALDEARGAANRILATHRVPSGGVAHAALASSAGAAPKQLFLADNAAFGWGLTRLAEVDPDPRWRGAARAIADVLLAELGDPSGGGLFASTRDPDAFGALAERRVPFEENVLALRFLVHLSRLVPSAGDRHAIARLVRAVSRPDEIKARGRWLGDFLFALEEVRGLTP